MKRISALLIAILISLSVIVSCKAAPTYIQAFSPSLTESVDHEVTPDVEPTAKVNNPQPALEIVSSVAYLFNSGRILYGAVEYKNTGNCNIVLTNAQFTFSDASTSLPVTFTPMLSEYDVVEPGATSFVTYWGNNPADEILLESENITVTAELTPVATDDVRRDLELSDIRVLDNYPGFSTLSGLITSSQTDACTMNMSYVAFYDADDTLLGVWNFTLNSVMNPGDIRSFVINMNDLTIENLSSRTASTKACGFGFNL